MGNWSKGVLTVYRNSRNFVMIILCDGLGKQSRVVLPGLGDPGLAQGQVAQKLLLHRALCGLVHQRKYGLTSAVIKAWKGFKHQ